ncbi:MAG: SO2930 family diheme c-type cytochrome [Nannocystaceae bacterium]
MATMIQRALLSSALVGAVAAAATCTTTDPCAGPTRCPATGELPFPVLSDYDFFQGSMVEEVPKDGVIPYTVVAPLWSDQAGKGRFIVLPEGGKIDFEAREGWGYPEGSIIIKSFYFDHDRRDPSAGSDTVETRLLIRKGGEWEPVTYLWNEEQTEATLLKVGKRVEFSFIDEDGASKDEEYIVPNLDQCRSCHERSDEMHSLGTVTPQLNFEVEKDGKMVNQLEWLAEQGLFSGALPAVDTLDRFAAPFDADAFELDDRARSYLHANCAHCHRDGGAANKSGIDFLRWETDPEQFGVCKLPAAAGAGAGGRLYDILPGRPEESIVTYRMNSLDPEIKMPELPNRVIDEKGLALITEWIAAMPVKECGVP